MVPLAVPCVVCFLDLVAACKFTMPSAACFAQIFVASFICGIPCKKHELVKLGHHT